VRLLCGLGSSRLGLLRLLRGSIDTVLALWAITLDLELLQAPFFPTLTLFLDQPFPFSFLLSTNYVAHGGGSAKEVRVVSIDVGALNRDE
jgi:hypothetical protein